MRKKLLILITVLLLVLVGLSVYVFVLRGQPLAPPDDEAFSPPEDILSERAGIDPEADLVQLSARPAVHMHALEGGALLVVFGDGTIAFFDETGTRTEEHSTGFSPVVSARISPNGEHVALEVLDTSTLTGQWYVWQRDSVSVESLSSNVRDVQFAPDNTLARIESTEERGTRVILERGGRDQTIYSSPLADLTVQWIDNTSLLLGTTPSGAAPGIAYVFNTRTRATTRLLGGRSGLVAFADAEQNLLFSATINGRSLRSYMLSDREERDLRFVTIPERCTLPEAGRLLCSTIENQGGATLMPDDYYSGVVANKRSQIVQINMQSGVVLPLREAPLDVTHPAVSEDGRYMFVINKNDGSVWRLRLGGE